MAEPKTKRTGASVTEFIDAVEDPRKRKDARAVMRIMREVTGKRPTMWGPSIVGYGSYHYRYASGREGEWPLTGLSPRKDALTVYIMSGFAKRAGLLKRLGPHKASKACLYIKRLDDVDTGVLRQLIELSVAETQRMHG
jgi:hypothetical protein